MTKRRDFLKQSLGAGFAIGGIGFKASSYGAIVGANDRINMAVIGIRNQGTVHLNRFCDLHKSHNVVVKTICDVDELLFEPAAKIVREKIGVEPQAEWDLRKVLDDPEIDAVSIVTPNHWHALATVWACQAGKHVYVEKPVSHNIWEGRKMVQAARKHNVMAQAGLNNRSSRNVREAIQFLHDGGIGEVYMARAVVFKGRDSYGIARNSAPPETFHYDLWLGPAPYRPYNVKRSHYCWHWYWDTGNGDTGNTGPHMLDLARWGLNKYEHPVTVYSAGGIYGLQEDGPMETQVEGRRVYGDVMVYGRSRTSQETPNTQTAVFKYEDGTMLELETRGRYTNHEGSQGQEVGNLFYGSEGWLEISGSSWKAFREREREPFAGSQEGEDEGNHWANFLDALRSGKQEKMHCPVNEGFYSSTLPLLANISYRVGRGLEFVGASETFADDPEADALLTRVYREPYVVPEKV